MTFLKDKDRHFQHAEPAGAMAKGVRICLHAVADIHEGIDAFLLCLLEGVLQDPFDLRVAAKAKDTRHRADQRLAVRGPAGGAKLSKSAKECDLELQPADCGR